MKRSTFLSLKSKDIVKGLITAVGTAFLAGVYQTLNSGEMPGMDDIKPLCLSGMTAGVAYLLKNLFTNSDDKFMVTEPVKK